MTVLERITLLFYIFFFPSCLECWLAQFIVKYITICLKMFKLLICPPTTVGSGIARTDHLAVFDMSI